MKKYIYPALLSNALCLGVHWIYDVKYLESLSKNESLLFLVQDKKRFDEATPSYYAYPNTKLGDLTVQGEILKWLYQALSSNLNFNQSDYKNLLLNKFLPGGAYKGYVETYAKKLVALNLLDQLNISDTHIVTNDNHLVGFMPYLLSKELNFSLDKAWSLAQLFTNHPFYLQYYKMFDFIFDHLDDLGLRTSLIKAQKLAPKEMHETLEKAISINDTNHFIDTYASRACSIEDAIPVIIHILYHTKDFESALELNAKIGGASSDRALLIGAILSQVYGIPKAWIKQIPPEFYTI